MRLSQVNTTTRVLSLTKRQTRRKPRIRRNPKMCIPQSPSQILAVALFSEN